VLSGNGHCHGPISSLAESYRVCVSVCVCVCVLLSVIRCNNNPLNLKCECGKPSEEEDNNHEVECQTNRTMFKQTVRFTT